MQFLQFPFSFWQVIARAEIFLLNSSAFSSPPRKKLLTNFLEENFNSVICQNKIFLGEISNKKALNLVKVRPICSRIHGPGLVEN